MMDDDDDLVSALYPLSREVPLLIAEVVVCLLQDFAALDALEATHYAAKQTQRAILPVAGAASHQVHAARLHPLHQHQIQTSNPCSRQEHVDSLTAAEGWHRQISDTATVPQSHFAQQASAASAQSCHCPKQQFPKPQLRQAPRQSSMQSFMTAHAHVNCRPLDTSTLAATSTVAAVAHAVPAVTHVQHPAKPMQATGMLVDDLENCIDLTSQPEAGAPQLDQGHRIEQHGQPAGYEHAVADEAAAHQRASADKETGIEEDIMDDRPEDLLMECSTNLLNPGIRVHKYSIAFLLHAPISCLVCCASCLLLKLAYLCTSIL